MVKTSTDCQEKFNNGKINMYSQLDSRVQFRIDQINKIKQPFYC